MKKKKCIRHHIGECGDDTAAAGKHGRSGAPPRGPRPGCQWGVASRVPAHMDGLCDEDPALVGYLGRRADRGRLISRGGRCWRSPRCMFDPLNRSGIHHGIDSFLTKKNKSLFATKVKRELIFASREKMSTYTRFHIWVIPFILLFGQTLYNHLFYSKSSYCSG
jgi:hypothetical protein